MNDNIIEFDMSRRDKMSQKDAEIINVIEQGLERRISSSLLMGKSALDTIRDFDKFIDSGIEGKVGEMVRYAYRGKYKHLANQYIRNLDQMMRYLRLVRFHLSVSDRIVINPDISNKFNCESLSPVLGAVINMARKKDTETRSAIVLTTRTIFQKTPVEKLDASFVVNSPKFAISADNSWNIDELPKICWQEGVKEFLPGRRHPHIVHKLLSEFLADGMGCNLGLRYRRDGDMHIFSYMYIRTEHMIVWELTLNGRIYKVDIPGIQK